MTMLAIPNFFYHEAVIIIDTEIQMLKCTYVFELLEYHEKSVFTLSVVKNSLEGLTHPSINSGFSYKIVLKKPNFIFPKYLR